jgi:predicted dehydrogenase
VGAEGRWPGADTELYGTGGYARVWEETEPPPDYGHCTQPMYSAQLAEFVEAVTAGRQPRPSGEDGRVVVEIVERAYAAAGSRQG